MFLVPSPAGEQQSPIFTTMLEVSYTISEFFFAYGPGNEEHRLILGALIQNLKSKAPVRNY